MAAPIPDQGAIAHLGGQFHHNVFEHLQKKANASSKKYAAAHQTQVKQTADARERFAQSAAQGIKQGQAAYAKNVAGQQKQAQQAAKAHAAGVKSGKVAPAQGAPPRTFAMGSTPQQKAAQKTAAKQSSTMQQQRNFAHGEALKFQSAQFKVKQQQVNNAHGQAIQEAKQRSKGGPVNTTSTPKAPSLSPSFSSAPATHTPVKAKPIASTSFSSQLAPQKPLAGPQGSTTASFSSGSGNWTAKPPKPLTAGPSSPSLPHIPGGPMQRAGSVTNPQFSSGTAPKANGAYPQHTHPEGSSTAPLPNLTASQPKPNTFTTGSRNAKPGGIAARGSQLEAWAIGRTQQIRQQRQGE